MAEDEVAAEAIAERHRPLEVDAIAFGKLAERRPLERLGADVGGHFPAAQSDHRQTDPVHCNTVPARQVVELRLHRQAHTLWHGLDRGYSSDVFDQAGEHGVCIA
jgi:hypothetical protein